MKPKIYLFINSRRGEDCVSSALSEDGHFLSGHFSSNEWFAKHDMGLTSDWKHDEYRKHYPDGYELEWVDKPKDHIGLNLAYAKHLALPKPADAAVTREREAEAVENVQMEER